MEDKNIEELLQIILNSIDNKKINWRLNGSVNLKIQGVETSVRDLDINTDKEGLDIFREALKKFLVKDFFDEKLKFHSLVYDIKGFEVEIIWYEDERSMLDKTKEIIWQGMQIPILPLKDSKKFYEIINRKEKVDLISKYT